MKYLLALFFVFPMLSYSQDLIYLVNGDSIVSKVTEMSNENIKYKDFNNLDGTPHIISKEQVSKIVLNNVNEAVNSKTKETNLEETKAIIIEMIDKYAFSKDGDYKFIAKFNQNFLALKYVEKEHLEEYLWQRYYDFSDECIFNNLSIKNNGICYVNVKVHRVNKDKNGEFNKKNKKDKLAIYMEDYDNAKLLQDALIRYNDYFRKTIH